jgi:N-acetylneuraminic acid mutarotase
MTKGKKYWILAVIGAVICGAGLWHVTDWASRTGKPSDMNIPSDTLPTENMTTGGSVDYPWKRLADMPQAREQHGFEQLNGILYVVGGMGSSHEENTVYAYDVSTDTWTTKAPVPVALQSPVLRAVNGKLYLIGGYDSTIPLKYNTTYEYDPVANTWTRKANTPTAREDMASAVIDGKIYVFGGITNPGHKITPAVEVYDPATDAWETKNNMPNPRCLGDFGCAYNGKIYLVSGTDTMKGYKYRLYPSMRVDEYNPATDTWTQKANIPTGRCYKEVEELNGLLYVVSGATASVKNHTYSTEVYNVSNNSWSVGPNTPYSARGAGLAKYDGKIYFCGGFSGRALKRLYSFDPNVNPANVDFTK